MTFFYKKAMRCFQPMAIFTFAALLPMVCTSAATEGSEAESNAQVESNTVVQGASTLPDNPTAEAVMRAVDERYTGLSRRVEGVLTLIDKDGNKRLRSFVEYAKKYGKDEKSASLIVSPPEVRGTAFMSYEWKDQGRDDETWLYLPQVKKVKRLATTDKSGYFLGSDFTYADFVGLEVEDYVYEFMPDEQHWVIIAEPRPDIRTTVINETGYDKIKYWVDKDRLIVVKTQYWLSEGKKVKYYTAENLKEVEGIWTVHTMKMVLTQGGKVLHGSVYQLDTIDYDIDIQDEMFTPYAMERGFK